MAPSGDGNCPACGERLSTGARFCSACGTPTAPPTCDSCGELLPPNARFCAACGEPVESTAHARTHAAPGPVAERRTTSVLFADLVGFTPLSESRDAEDVREILSRYFGECRTVIGRYGGTVEKFIGDAVMAVWGAPAAHEDDAERAVRAGLELVQVVAGLGESLGTDGLAIRVGVVTGEVAVTLGASGEGMVAGDAVNTAARVQSAAGSGQVWADDATRRLTHAAIAYIDAGEHELKGKAEPVHLWQARDVVAEVGGGQRVDGLEASLTGRARELRLVKELFHSTAESGRPRLLVLDGEPGVGKSRLAWEFEKYIDGLTARVRWHRGRCMSYGGGTAFWALSEAVRGRLGLVEADTGAIVGERLEEWLAAYVNDQTERDWIRPRVAALIGESTSSTFTRADLFAAWTTFFERTGADDAVVLVIDDAQYADDALLDFLDHLMGTARCGVFVLALARPELLERRHDLGARRASVVRLEPLDDAVMADLVDGLVGGLSVATRSLLVERSEGIPLFAVETVRALIDRDAIVPRDGRYVAAADVEASLKALGAPASLQALVAARLDGLTPPERQLVADASVLGFSFTRDGLDAIAGGVDGVDDVLASLQRKEILSVVQDRRSPEFGQFKFMQGVVRQVAYSTLSKRDRKARHLAVAAYLARVGDDSDELCAVVAQHLVDALDLSASDDVDRDELAIRATDQLERAGKRAARVGAPTEAVSLYRAALRWASDSATEGRLHLAAARAAIDGGDYHGSADHAARAAALFDAAGLRFAAGEAAGWHAASLSALGQHAEAIDIARPWWDELDGRPGAERALLDLAGAMAHALYNRGEIEESTPFHQRRLMLAEAIGDLQEIAMALITIGMVYGSTGAPITSRGLTELAAQIARENDLSAPLARALNNLASMLGSRDLPAAIRVAQEGMDVARRASMAGNVDYTSINYLMGLWHAGRLAELRSGLVEARQTVSHPSIVAALGCVEIRLAEASGEPLPPVPDMTELTGESDTASRLDMEIAHAVNQGDLKLAAALAEESLPHVIAGMGIDDDFMTLWTPLVGAALAAGDPALAERLMEPIASAPSAIVSVGVRAHWLGLRGRLRALRGDDPRAVEEDLRAGIAALDAFGAIGYRARAQEELGRWLVDQGRSGEAAEMFDAARSTYVDIGAAGWLATLEAAVFA